MVLRGLDLYWYRQVNDEGQKGMMQLPAKPVKEEVIDDQKWFALEKDTNVPDTRRLVFLDNGDHVMDDFRNKVTIMTNLKMYID